MSLRDSIQSFFSQRVVKVTTGAVLVFLLWIGVGVPVVPPVQEVTIPRPSISWIASNAGSSSLLLQEQATLFDSAPLFLPTPWNSAPTTLSTDNAFGKSEKVLLNQFPPDVYLVEEASSFSLEDQLGTTLGEVQDVLDQENWDFFDGFGQEQKIQVPVVARGLSVEVVNVDSGDLVRKLSLDHIDNPSFKNNVWKPLSYILAVAPNGEIGAPFGVVSTGNQTLDDQLEAVVEDIVSDMDLDAGYYRLNIGY